MEVPTASPAANKVAASSDLIRELRITAKRKVKSLSLSSIDPFK